LDVTIGRHKSNFFQLEMKWSLNGGDISWLDMSYEEIFASQANMGGGLIQVKHVNL